MAWPPGDPPKPPKCGGRLLEAYGGPCDGEWLAWDERTPVVTATTRLNGTPVPWQDGAYHVEGTLGSTRYRWHPGSGAAPATKGIA